MPAIARLREVAAGAPDEVNLTATWWTIPAAPDFPQELHGRAVVSLEGMYVGPPAEGEKPLQPLREVEQPLIDLSETLPYTTLQQLFDPFFPAGDLHYYWKSIYLAGLEDEAVRTIGASVAARPSPMSMVTLWPLGGALGEVDASATAIGARDAPFLVEILANWADPDESDANVAWAQELVAALEPFGTGRTNLNFPGLGDEPDFVRAGFGPSWDRLVEVKRRYDPSNLFRLNQNVDPNGAG